MSYIICDNYDGRFILNLKKDVVTNVHTINDRYEFIAGCYTDNIKKCKKYATLRQVKADIKLLKTETKRVFKENIEFTILKVVQ